MAQSKLSLLGNKVWSAVKDAFSFDYNEKVCLQCHCPVYPRERFCSQRCCMQYWREFQHYCFTTSGKKMCGLPGCSKPCYVEHGRIHDYCGRTHATEHAAMMDAVFTSKKSKSKGNGSKTKGHQSQSHSQFASQTQHGGFYTTSAFSPSYWYAKHDTRRGPIRFYNRDDPYYEFTNFYPASIYLDGKDWPTSEHYFQAQKFTGTPYVEQIRLLARPRQAFDLSRDPSVSRWRRRDWEDTKLHVMYKALLAKFTQHDELRTLLLLTGERELIEHTPYDSFWGNGGNDTGLNHLGKMLMKIRSQLQGKKQQPTAETQNSFSPMPQSSFTNQPGVVVEHHQSSPDEELRNSYKNPASADQFTRAPENTRSTEATTLPSHSGPPTPVSPQPEQQPNRFSRENSMEDASSFYRGEGEGDPNAVKHVPFIPTSQQPPYLHTNQQLQRPPLNQQPWSSNSSQHLVQGVYTSTQELTNPVPITTTVSSAEQLQQVSMHSRDPGQLPLNPNNLAGHSLVSQQANSGQNQPSRPGWVVGDKPPCNPSQTEKARSPNLEGAPDLINF